MFLGYVSPQGYTLLDRRLYVPVEWLTDDAYAERRGQCGLPPDLTFRTKPALAQEMVAAVVKSQALRCRWVVADEAFGGNPCFLDASRGWACGILPKCPTPRGSGKRARHPHPAVAGAWTSPAAGASGGGRPRGADVLAVATALPSEAWTRQTIKEGSQAPWWRSLPPCAWLPCGTPCQA